MTGRTTTTAAPGPPGAAVASFPDLDVLVVAGTVWSAHAIMSHPLAVPFLAGAMASAQRLAAADPARATPGEVRAAARAFRYARGLLAAEELESWLSEVGLTAATWHDALRREVVADLDEPPPDAAPSELLWSELLWSTLVCGGWLAGAVAAVADAEAIISVHGPGSELAHVVADFRDRAGSDEAVQREINSNATEWLYVAAQWLALGSLDAGREARLCLSHDLDTPSCVSSLAGSPLQTGAWYLRDAPRALHGALLSTPTGSVAGPVEVDGTFTVIVVEERCPPTLGSAGLVRDVRTALADRATARLVEDRTRRLVRV